MNRRADASRVKEALPVVPLHERLWEEMAENPSADRELRRLIDESSLPPSYWTHPVVLKHGFRVPVHPVALFMDGVPTHRRDGVLCVTVHSLVTNVRHLVACLRKQDICKCGCRGWCSIFALHQWLLWCFSALAEGRWPDRRHDGTPFLEDSDVVRRALAGTDVGSAFALIFLKGDLMEYCTSWGLPSVGTYLYACPFCDWPGDDPLDDGDGLSALGAGWHTRTFDDYLEACSRCEITVHVTGVNDLVLIRGSLRYDRRARGPRGRALRRALPALGLKRGDRLEPTLEHPDVDWVDTAEVPCTLLFWRRSEETIARRRCPLFNKNLGIVPQRCFGLDWLHLLSLGVFKFFVARFMQALFSIDAWGAPQTTHEGRVEHSVNILRAELFAFYADSRRHGREYSMVQNLTSSMFGSTERPELSLHGSETNGYLMFCDRFLMPRYGGRLPQAEVWQRGISSLVRMYELVSSHRRVMEPAAVQSFVDTTLVHIRVCKALEFTGIPKHHFLMEMAAGLGILSLASVPPCSKRVGPWGLGA